MLRFAVKIFKNVSKARMKRFNHIKVTLKFGVVCNENTDQNALNGIKNIMLKAFVDS